MIALLPIVTLFILSCFLLWKAYDEFLPMQQQLELIPVIHQVNSLTHNLQIERGLSVAFLASKREKFYTRVLQQYKVTDKEVSKYKQNIESLKAKIVSHNMIQKITFNEKYFLQLHKQRQVIKEQPIDTTLKFYTDFINSHLELTENITHQKMTFSMARNFTAITAILNLKETMGIERAIGSLAIEQGDLSALQLQQFIQLLGQKKGFLKSFQDVATLTQLSQFNMNCTGQNILELEQDIFLSITEHKPLKMDTQVWFNRLSCEIEQLKSFSELLIKELTRDSTLKVNELRWQLYWVAGILISVFIVTLFAFLVLRKSIAMPLGRLTAALHDMAFENKKLSLKEHFIDDELGELFQSYEACRRRLLQADISSSINFIRLGFDLDEKTLEKNLNRREVGFGQLYIVFGLFYANLSLWFLSLSHGQLEEVLIFSTACVVQIVLGGKFHDGRFIGFGIVFLSINIYTRMFESFWDDLSFIKLRTSSFVKRPSSLLEFIESGLILFSSIIFLTDGDNFGESLLFCKGSCSSSVEGVCSFLGEDSSLGSSFSVFFSSFTAFSSLFFVIPTREGLSRRPFIL